MPFPIDPAPGEIGPHGLFPVHDPRLRACVLPLFRFDPEAPNERVEGYGTAFRIDPWSRCATAFHVLEALFEVDGAGKNITLKPDIRLAALEVAGEGGGPIHLPEDAWRPFAGSFSYFRIDKPPFTAARIRNLTELMVLRIRPPRLPKAGTPFLPVDFRRWQPKPGGRVLALGFANLDKASEEPADLDRPLAQQLFGSIGEILHVEPPDAGRDRPWPLIRVQADWPGGMSGGPVFNEAGHVIGLVSTGFEGDGGAAATHFSGWDVPERIFGSVDPDNPGRFFCWGAFDAAGGLVRCGQDRDAIEVFGRANGATDFGRLSCDPLTSCWTRSERISAE